MTSSTEKPYHEMTPAERLAARIAKNRSIEQNAAAVVVKAPERRVSAAAAAKAKPARTVLDQFQEIKRTHGIDAAAEFVRARKA